MSEWNCVKKTSPSSSLGRILVYTVNSRIQVLHRDYDAWCLTEEEHEGGYEISGGSPQFTHWMALPAAPHPGIWEKITKLFRGNGR